MKQEIESKIAEFIASRDEDGDDHVESTDERPSAKART
jgi:hypothetical protein